MFAVFAALTLAMSRVGGVLTYQGSPVSGNVLKHRPISLYRLPYRAGRYALTRRPWMGGEPEY